MIHTLTPTQAFWLGHLYQAWSTDMSLSHYAEQHGLNFPDLMRWEQRLLVQGINVPKRHRPARFVAVEPPA